MDEIISNMKFYIQNYQKKEAKQIEIYLIAYYNSTDHNYGYNKTKGGD